MLGTGCPYVLPGLRADVGAEVAAVTGRPVKPALHLTTGVSLGSVLREPRWYDVSAGYVLFYPSDHDTVHGGFVDVAWLKRFGGLLQLSVGPRVEALFQERDKGLHGGVGGALRVALEGIAFTDKSFESNSGSSGGLGFVVGQNYGNLALGVSTEVGVRRLPGKLYSGYAMIAVTFRLPASAGFALFIPFPK